MWFSVVRNAVSWALFLCVCVCGCLCARHAISHVSRGPFLITCVFEGFLAVWEMSIYNLATARLWQCVAAADVSCTIHFCVVLFVVVVNVICTSRTSYEHNLMLNYELKPVQNSFSKQMRSILQHDLPQTYRWCWDLRPAMNESRGCRWARPQQHKKQKQYPRDLPEQIRARERDNRKDLSCHLTFKSRHTSSCVWLCTCSRAYLTGFFHSFICSELVLVSAA